MKKFKVAFALLSLILSSCSSDGEDEAILDAIRLDSFLEGREVVLDNVIACAASNRNPELVSVFLYPRPGVSNIRYFETSTAEVDKNDFAQYTSKELPLFDVFNGHLLRYEIEPEEEKWVIVSFEEEGDVHVSNPIRLKQLSKPTEYLSENVMTDLSMGTMPQFTWEDGRFTDSRIYFHVVTNAFNDFLSGTYTFERRFQYYKLDNVVLNITEETPPILTPGTPYGFTLLAVSEDNWVNLFSEIPFELE
ncbi:hypothetical protein [Flagellimonas meridianipacifica]|uniref:NigD-like protein n=1 Tax=Flagellimonas meridianipacifica TaxID=1080225 RepID=A0A2T0MFS6_9FLAO|nr:hypothetical protein [Allomuricauda pacifica]PRX56414.1 hypothetical protein CLV81_0411 [Allomuricauda pacifica]